MKDRNLHPTAEAIIAMCIWSHEYSQQDGGSMDFYDKLSLGRKKECTKIVEQIVTAGRSYGYSKEQTA